MWSAGRGDTEKRAVIRARGAESVGQLGVFALKHGGSRKKADGPDGLRGTV